MQAIEQMYETDLSSLDVVFRESLGERRSKLKSAIAENGSIPEFNALPFHPCGPTFLGCRDRTFASKEKHVILDGRCAPLAGNSER